MKIKKKIEKTITTKYLPRDTLGKFWDNLFNLKTLRTEPIDLPRPSQYLLAQRQLWKHHNNRRNLFKLDNKDARKT